MATISAQDKASFQGRRTVEIQVVEKPQKKKFSEKFFSKLLPKTITVNKKHATITAVASIVVIGAGAFGYYQYLLSQNPAVIYAKKLQTITSLVGQQMSLPKDEQPVVATVSNIQQLPSESFFKNAQNGDKILLYKKHKEAILFRPSTGEVITYATLDFKDIIPVTASQVAGASTSATSTTDSSTSAVIISISPGPTIPFIPQGKILIRPQQ